MKRLSIVLVLLLVVAACGFSAWFALREVDLATDQPDRPTQGVVEPADVDDPDPVVEESGGRKHVRPIGSDGLPEAAANTVVGRVLYADVGVAGATVDVFAAPDGDYNVRRGQAREFFGDLFSDEELEQMEGRFGGMRARGRADAAADASSDSTSEDGAAIGVSISSDEGVDVSSIDLESDDMQDAMGAGMEFVGRMMSNPSLLEKALDLGRIEAAGFETDGAWPRVGSGKTEADGTFAIPGMPAGKVELRVSARGYVRLKKVVTVGEGGVELKLSRGTVLDGMVTSGGQPLAGATVRTKTRTLETDGAGRFSVDGAVTPKESVLVSARGFVTAGRSVALTTDGLNPPVVIELEPAALVRGIVLSSEGAPLAGASVRVTSGSGGFNPMMFMQLAQQDNVTAPAPSTITDENGVFELDGIPGGTVKLIAESRGYLPFTTEDIPVTAGESSEGIELKLLRESFVTGKVAGPGGGAVEGATVKVELDAAAGMGAMVAGMFGGSWASARTKADGTFRVGGLTAGERRVRVESSQYLHEEVVLQVPDEDGATQDFTLRPGYTLEGLVLTPSGDPAPGARVQVQWASEGGDNPLAAMTGMMRGADATGTADADGHFVIDGLQEGPYTVTAEADGFLDGTVDDVPQGATDVMVQLRAAAAIRGIVLDPDGNPIGGAWVHRKGGKRTGGNPMLAMFASDPRVLTAADGSFQFPDLEAGRYQLYARRKGYAESEKVKLQVAEGESAADVQLVLRAGESLMGRVVEAGSGNAIEGAIVYVVEGSSPMAGMNFREAIDSEPSAPSGAIQTRTEADGSFVLEGLTPGRVTVEVRSRDHAPASLARVEVPGTEVTVEVGMGGRVEGYVMDAGGNAVSGTQVILSGGAMGFGRQRLATSDENGFYEMDRVVPGTYQIMKMDSTSAFGVGGMSSAVVKEGETTRHDFKPDATGGGISGIVQRDGEPVDGAMVILSGGSVGMKMTTTGSDGAYTFEGLPPGSYSVSVQTGIMGGGRQTQTVRVEERQQVTGVTVQLSSLSLEGRVVDAETGEGIAMAQIILFDSGAGTPSSLEEIMRSSPGQAMTDQRGNFKITGIEDGTFSVRVSASGYAEETREGVKPGADLTLRLDPGAEFEVTVIGPDGAPVVGATVVARDAQGNETMAFAMGSMQAITTSDGTATLQLAPGRYTIVAESGGLPSGSADVDAERGSVVIRLEQGGGLEIVVKQGGKPFPGATVALLDENGLPIVKRVSAGNILGGGAETTDAAGRVVREGLPTGTITVVVTAPGGTPVQKTVSIARGGTEKIEIELP